MPVVLSRKQRRNVRNGRGARRCEICNTKHGLSVICVTERETRRRELTLFCDPCLARWEEREQRREKVEPVDAKVRRFRLGHQAAGG